MKLARAGIVAGLAVSVAVVWLTMVTGPDMMFGRLGLVGLSLWVALFAVLAERREWKAFGAVSIVPVLALCLGLSGLPGKARLALSERGIVEASAAARAGEQPARAGLFGVESSRVTDDGCVILVTQTIVFDEYGVAHCPGGVDLDDPYPELFHSIRDLYRYEVNN